MKGVEGSGLSAAGVSAGKRPRGKKQGAGIVDTVGDVIKTVAPLAPLLLAAGKKTRSRKKVEGGQLGLAALENLHGQPLPTAPANAKETMRAEGRPARKLTTKADMPGAYIAGAKPKRAPNARNELVKKVMKEHGLSLPSASKYIKEHNLYN